MNFSAGTSFVRLLSILSCFLPLSMTGQQSAEGAELLLLAAGFKKQSVPDSALVFFLKAAEAFEEAGDSRNLVKSLNEAATILNRQDRIEEAIGYLDKAYAVSRAAKDTFNLETATTFITLGVSYGALEDYPKSILFHQRALNMRIAISGRLNGDVATSYGNIGNVHFNRGDYDGALAAHTQAMEIRREVFGEESPEIAESYSGLGRVYRQRKEYDQAVEYFEMALNNKIKQKGEGHSDLVRYYSNLSDALQLQGNKEKSQFYQEKAEAIRQ